MSAAAHVVLAEARKGLRVNWYYKFNMVMQLVTLTAIFLFLVFFLGHGSMDPGQLTSALLGYVVWFYAVNMVSWVGIDLVSEAQTGTLEQMCMSVSPPELLLLGRAVAALVTTTGLVAVLDLVLLASFGVSVPVSGGGLLMLALTLTGLFGFGLMIGGAMLVFKHVGALANLMINMIIFTNGTLLPVDEFPRWLTTIANSLPSTQGVTMLRESVLQGRSLAAMWSDGGLPGLLLNTGIYLGLGVLVFEVGIRRARVRGSLGQY
ncbi:ABC transporter permease [Amycolatopsis circi]|uniref:ABC transporter permease n=1 Tax=Amycolatopsis circi TaxID=871959 RepID=UPI000E223220|nr:ABC transporter permease [Amycolatopsis circi]